MSLRQLIAGFVFPRYSILLERVNQNALLKRWNKEIVSSRECEVCTDMFEFVEQKFAAGGTLTYLEFGVWKGDSIQHFANLNSNPESRFFGFDSFEGLPADWTPHMKKGTFDLSGVMPIIHDHRVKLIKGLFNKSIPIFVKRFEPSGRLILYIDCDLFNSALYVLASFSNLLVDGTNLVLDDFDEPLGVSKALYTFVKAFGVEVEVVGRVGDREFLKTVAFRIKESQNSRPPDNM